jgi:hypothetical protein
MTYIINYWDSYNKHGTSCHLMIPIFSTFYTALINCYNNSTERRMVQEKTIMEGNQNLCLIFCCVFGTLVNNSLEEFGSSK